jgi:transposase
MKKPRAKQKNGKGAAKAKARKKPGRPPAKPLQLTPEQLREIEKAKSKTLDFRLRSRLLALTWSNEGKTEQEIAALLDLSRRTIHNWIKTYRKHGLTKLLRLEHAGDPGNLNKGQIEKVKEEVKTGRFHCVREVQSWINDTFGTTYTYGGAKALLHRIGCSYHKTSGFLFKADHDQQKAWVVKHENQRAKYKGDITVRFYFCDGVHLIYGLEIIFCCWLLVGQRLNVGVGSGRKRFNILGAYCPDGHEYLDVRSSDKNVTGETLIDLMKVMRLKHPEVKKFIIYLDNARYNHAKLAKGWIEEQKKEGVEFVLEHLPTYSPNLNLIERLWKFLRKKAMRAWYQTFEEMQQAIANVLDNLDKYTDERDTLMTERFRLVPKKEENTVQA